MAVDRSHNSNYGYCYFWVVVGGLMERGGWTSLFTRTPWSYPVLHRVEYFKKDFPYSPKLAFANITDKLCYSTYMHSQITLKKTAAMWKPKLYHRNL